MSVIVWCFVVAALSAIILAWRLFHREHIANRDEQVSIGYPDYIVLRVEIAIDEAVVYYMRSGREYRLKVPR